MRIGLASDTYGNLDPLEKALELFVRERVDRVFFLGGRVSDLDAVLARRRGGSRGAAVPGSDAEFLSAVEGALSRQVAAPADPLEGRVVRVASRACPEYATPAARKQMDLVEGRICCLVHDKAALSRDDIENASLFFHGNSAYPAIVQIGARFFVTPGHLREPAPVGCPATFAVLEARGSELLLTAYSPSGEPMGEDRASFAAAAGKLSVRG